MQLQAKGGVADSNLSVVINEKTGIGNVKCTGNDVWSENFNGFSVYLNEGDHFYIGGTSIGIANARMMRFYCRPMF